MAHIVTKHEAEHLKWELKNAYRETKSIPKLAERFQITPRRARELLDEAFLEQSEMPDTEDAFLIWEAEFHEDLDQLQDRITDRLDALSQKSDSLAVPNLVKELRETITLRYKSRGGLVDRRKVDVQHSSPQVVTINFDRASHADTRVIPGFEQPLLEDVTDAEVIDKAE